MIKKSGEPKQPGDDKMTNTALGIAIGPGIGLPIGLAIAGSKGVPIGLAIGAGIGWRSVPHPTRRLGESTVELLDQDCPSPRMAGRSWASARSRTTSKWST
jgi:hypothetical protein